MSKTSNHILLKYILCLLIFNLTYTAHSQINLKVGYTLGYSDLEETKSIFERFNENNPQAEKSLSSVNFYNGIELGLRYKFQHFGFELGLSSISGESEALNVFQPDGSLGKETWNISLINYYIGFENYFGNFGYGATIGSQKLKYKTNISGRKSKKTIFDKSVLNSKFYLILEVPSNLIAFSIRPYISTTWKPFNIHKVALEIEPMTNVPESNFDQDVIVYGISVLFYNGPQRR